MTVPGNNRENPEELEEPRVVVRDRRKIDPETGELRSQQAEAQPLSGLAEPGAAVPSAAGVAGEAPAQQQDLQTQLDERTADLQRLQAEYANYRRRVERDRELAKANAKAGLAGELLLVLDDVDRAERHGDLTGAFKAVADKLVATLTQAGLEPFGAEGEAFDPNVHEAVQHDTSAEVAGPTVTAVLRHGYRMGERVVRSALVGVTDYEAPAAEHEPAEQAAAESDPS